MTYKDPGASSPHLFGAAYCRREILECASGECTGGAVQSRAAVPQMETLRAET
jgi:hypothetical protein